jgi:hypothetical protein
MAEKKLYDHSEKKPESISEPAMAYMRKVSGIDCSSTLKDLNPAQLYLVQSLSLLQTEEEFNDLKECLQEFFFQQIDKQADKLAAEGKLGDDLLKEHLRTPYRFR